MSTLEKMKILTDSAQYDLCDYVSHHKSSQINLPGIYEAIGHNGCKIPLFKTLMSNKCKNDCKYCINQSNRTFTRLELKPEELAKAFMTYYNKGLVNGLFLSSGKLFSKSAFSTVKSRIRFIAISSGILPRHLSSYRFLILSLISKSLFSVVFIFDLIFPISELLLFFNAL